jgi:hypothetical protein
MQSTSWPAVSSRFWCTSPASSLPNPQNPKNRWERRRSPPCAPPSGLRPGPPQGGGSRTYPHPLGGSIPQWAPFGGDGSQTCTRARLLHCLCGYQQEARWDVSKVVQYQQTDREQNYHGGGGSYLSEQEFQARESSKIHVHASWCGGANSR